MQPLVDRIAVDAGPLIALARIGCLPILPALFPEVSATSIVLAEVQALPGYPEGDLVAAAMTSGYLQVVTTEPVEHDWGLDAGEASTINLALSCDAGVLMDDRAGRRIAAKLSIPLIGVLGLLVLAKRKGELREIRPLLRQLADSGYYLSRQVIEDACRQAGE